MFRKIMIPVDLDHREGLDRVFSLSATLAKIDGATLFLVHVGSAAPGAGSRGPADLERALETLAAEVATAQHVPVEAHTVISHDPAAELNDALLGAAKAIGADLIVAGSHVPVLGDRFLTSHAGFLAEQAEISVFVLRNA